MKALREYHEKRNQLPTYNFIMELRHGQRVNLFDRQEKHFVALQLNRKNKRVCWERWVSKDRANWVKWNECLSLSECLDVRAEIAIRSQAACFN